MFDDEQAFRRAAEAAIAYRRGTSEQGSAVAPYRDVLGAFSAPLPESGSDPVEIIDELVANATPGLRAMTSPLFLGWVIGGSHNTGVAADWLTSAWGQNSGNVIATPAAAAAEQVSADWLLELLDLPRTSSIGFVTGATVANFVALAAARGEQLRRTGWDVEKDGLFGAPPLSVMIGADAHTTVYSALRYLGLGSERVITIATDDVGRMQPAALAGAFKSVEGPAIVIAQAGQINTGACDPFTEICSIAHEHGAWVHVDGAFGLWAQASPRFRHLTQGVELADSWATDGHKWLQLPYDSGFAIVKDRVVVGLQRVVLEHRDRVRRIQRVRDREGPRCARARNDGQGELFALRPGRGPQSVGLRARAFAAGTRVRGLGHDQGARPQRDRRDGRTAL